MGRDTTIEWTDHTWNPWRGCVEVSMGCSRCYARTLARRNPAVLGTWGADGARVVAKEAYWDLPVAWDRAAREAGVRRRVFCLSLGDLFEDRPDLAGPRERAFATIRATRHLDWLLLSKRPENIPRLASEALGWDVVAHGMPPDVWLGATVEGSPCVGRAPLLRRVPAAVHFLSVEPLLDDLAPALHLDGIAWVIVGGESGPGARPMRSDWARRVRDRCVAAGVSFFFKQWGDHDADGRRVGKARAGRILDDREWSEFPVPVAPVPLPVPEGSATCP